MCARGIDAQSFSLGTGFSIDINNNRSTTYTNLVKPLYHIPIVFIYKPGDGGFLFRIDYDIPVAGGATVYAYTLNPTLPAKIALQETIRANIFNGSMGWFIPARPWKNRLSLYILVGFSNQTFKVSYASYNKVNYDILNPDMNLATGGLIISTGLVYSPFLEKTNSLDIMIHIQSPPLAGTGDYTPSYRLVAPLQCVLAYHIQHKKITHYAPTQQ
jgi:hypothetical protein